MSRRTVEWAALFAISMALAIGCASAPRGKSAPTGRREGMHQRIAELRREIQNNQAELGGASGGGVGFPGVPRTSDGGSSAPEPMPAPESDGAVEAMGRPSRCERICDIAEAICQDAHEICQIADELDEDDARAACTDAQQSCRSARAKCDRCR